MYYFKNKVEVVSQGNVNYLDMTLLQRAREQWPLLHEQGSSDLPSKEPESSNLYFRKSQGALTSTPVNQKAVTFIPVRQGAVTFAPVSQGAVISNPVSQKVLHELETQFYIYIGSYVFMLPLSITLLSFKHICLIIVNYLVN